MVFSGRSFVCENGTVLAESFPYQSGLIFSEADVEKLTYERERITGFPRECPAGYEKIGFALELRKTELTRPVSAHPFIPAGGADAKSAARRSSICRCTRWPSGCATSGTLRR